MLVGRLSKKLSSCGRVRRRPTECPQGVSIKYSMISLRPPRRTSSILLITFAAHKIHRLAEILASASRRSVRVRLIRKRLSNTPVLGKGFVLKFSDERRTEGFSTQTTYTRGSSGVGGGIHEQRHAAKRVLQESRFELRYAESPREQ